MPLETLTGAQNPDGRLVSHFQTDRPIYQPGQTVLYKAILRQGRRTHPRRQPGQGRTRRSKAAHRLDRLADCDLSGLAFRLDPNGPFTHHPGEQDLRRIKVKQKISGCFRTLFGAQVFARIRSYLSTCRKQGRNLWQALQGAVSGSPFIPSAPPAGP